MDSQKHRRVEDDSTTYSMPLLGHVVLLFSTFKAYVRNSYYVNVALSSSQLTAVQSNLYESINGQLRYQFIVDRFRCGSV